MNKIVGALEKLGASSFAFEEISEIEKFLLGEGLTNEEVELVRSGNVSGLESVLDARSKIVCMLIPAKDDEDDSEGDEPEEETPDTDEKSQIVNF